MIPRTATPTAAFPLVGLTLFLAACSRDASSPRVANTTPPDRIDFNAHIRPILNTQCTACHGGVKAAGGISFVFREDALRKGESGKLTIVPGKPDDSEVIRRITSTDPDYRQSPTGQDFRQDLTRRYGEQVDSERAMDPAARTAWRQQQWRDRLQSLLRQLASAERADTRSSAVWKAVVAERMKSRTEATNAWLATEVGIGSAPYLSKQSALARAGKLGPVAAELTRRLQSKDRP